LVTQLDAHHQEAQRLGHFREADLLVGLDCVIRLAAALNANVSRPSPKLARALDTARMPYMVIGGQAVLLHGESRLCQL